MPIQPVATGENSPQKDVVKFDQSSLIKLLTKNDDDLEFILAKRPQDLTEDEIRRVSERRLSLPAGSEKEALFQFEQAFFDDKFGAEPAEFDATGRLIEPKARNPINRTPVPARTPEGTNMVHALERLARRVADVAASEGTSNAVRFLQRGLNILNHAVTHVEIGRTEAAPNGIHRRRPAQREIGGRPMFQDIKDDGVPGPKTRSAMRTVVARLGPAKAEEAMALGRFDNFIRSLHKGTAERDLGRETQAAFGHLFRDGQKHRRPARTEEAESLQMAINDLGQEILGRDAFQGIREDGTIGPKTHTGFKNVLAASGPDRMTNALGRNLGFFSFDAR